MQGEGTVKLTRTPAATHGSIYTMMGITTNTPHAGDTRLELEPSELEKLKATGKLLCPYLDEGTYTTATTAAATAAAATHHHPPRHSLSRCRDHSLSGRPATGTGRGGAARSAPRGSGRHLHRAQLRPRRVGLDGVRGLRWGGGGAARQPPEVPRGEGGEVAAIEIPREIRRATQARQHRPGSMLRAF